MGKLTDTRLRTAKAADKVYKLFDGGGLYLEVRPTGAKRWRYKYTIGGRSQTLSLGEYPTVTLERARREHMAARDLVRQGISPTTTAKREKAERIEKERLTFQAMGEEWLAYRLASDPVGPSAEDHARRALQRLYKHLGNLPIHQIDVAQAIDAVKAISADGQHVAMRAKNTGSAVFKYAIIQRKASQNPFRDVPLKINKAKHHNAFKITDRAKLREFLEKLAEYSGAETTKLALLLLLLTFCRKMELVHAKWEEIDLDNAWWKVPSERMKMGEDHHVPLSRQAVEHLRRLHELTGEGEGYLFPHAYKPGKPMGHSTLNWALTALDVDVPPHGFRGSAASYLYETERYRSEAIERQLAHKERNSTKAAYNHAEFLKERRRMMQDWADYLDTVKAGAKVVPIQGAKTA